MLYLASPTFVTFQDDRGLRGVVEVGTSFDCSDDDSGTISGRVDQHGQHALQVYRVASTKRCSSHTWTSFSPRATCSTIRARAALSGFESRRNSASRIIWSSGLMRESQPCRVSYEVQRRWSDAYDTMVMDGLGAYLVLLRLARARGLLSTLGGRLFGIVS